MRSLEKTYCVYKHTNKFNGKVYIGITSQLPEKRWKNGYGYEGNEYFYRAIQKYGWDKGFEHEIIVSGLTKEQACKIEIELIKAYDSTNSDKGYNFSSGGDCGNAGCSRSEEWVEKMSEALSKPVICVESSIVYKSVKHAEQETGVRAGSIGAVCRGDYGHQTAGNLHWCFWDEEWSNFKATCKNLGVDYIKCEKCGVLMVKGNTRPKKYCAKCSGHNPVGIKKKHKTINTKVPKMKRKKTIVDNKRPMGKRNNTK
jgi:phage FluMu protein Com